MSTLNELGLTQEFEELKRMFPKVDMSGWALIDIRGWGTYDNGGTYWLLEKDECLYQLSNIVSTAKRPLDWEADKHETTLAEWLSVCHEVDTINHQRNPYVADWLPSLYPPTPPSK